MLQNSTTSTIESPSALAPPYRRPTGKRKALLALATAVFTAFMIASTILGYYAYKAHRYYGETTRNFGWEGDSYVRDDPDLGYVPTDNASTRHRLYPAFSIFTDSRGGRVGGPNQTAPASVDVLTVGCSFTWGHGMEDCDTFARCLERQTGLCVYNVGESSYGTTHAFLSMKRYADLRPKVIVYGYIDDHKLRSICPSAQSICPIVRPVPFVDFDEQDRPFVHPPIGNTELHDRYLRDVIMDHSFGVADVYWAMYRDYLKLTLPANVYYSANDPRISPKLLNYAAWSIDPVRLQRVLNFLVAEMAAQAKATGAKLVIAHFPTLDQWSGPPPNLLEAVAAANAPDTLVVVDTYPLLRALADEKGMDAVFIPHDNHPTPAANARIAEALEPMVRKLTGSIQR